MKKTSSSLVTAMVFVLSLHNVIFAYDGKAHSKICEAAAENSQLDLILRDMLGFENGTETVLQKGNKTKPVWKWIAYGGEAEDFGMPFDIPQLSTRAFNHFHDPLLNWNEAGLDSCLNFLYQGRYGRSPASSILWGLEPGRQDFSLNSTGDWSWGKAREHYYIYLTGRDFQGNVVATTKANREEYFADCLRAVGQVMHLLQDASVPLHTRNDVHILPGTYESFVNKQNANDASYISSHSVEYADQTLLNVPQPDQSYTHLAPITGLFDRNIYQSGGPIPLNSDFPGLAEYSNANFLTEDTMWEYPHPSLSETNYDSAIWLNPEEVNAEDGEKDYRIYFRKDAGDPIEHLMAAGYWYDQLYMRSSSELKYTFILDEKCYADYASKLVPRAVGYSAALLDYFFRGKLEVSALPVFVENAIYGIRLKIKNVTPTGEAMTMSDEDRLVLVCRYTPDGANPDGSEDKFVMANAYSCIDGDCDADGNLDGIQYGDEATIYFYLPEEEENRIGMQIFKSAEESVKCMLVFKGTMGLEETAVVGKYFTLGQDQIKFNEEWDNGLTGNHPWFHSYTTNPDNGSSFNIVENGILTKDNTRFENYETARYNESYLDFESAENPDGLLITPDSYLEFKIDEMSIDASNPDVHLQDLGLIFNNEILIIFSQEGQNNYPCLSYFFSYGENTAVNMYSLFEGSGIEMPDPLYLTTIDILQQFLDVENPPEIQENQHMEVDYIRIVEEKHEE